MAWREAFNERELKEMELATLYANNFNHGTDGHNRLNLIAKLIIIADTQQDILEFKKETK